MLIVSVGADISLGRIRYLEPFLEASVNLTSHRIEVDGERVFTVPNFAATAGLHVGAHFL